MMKKGFILTISLCLIPWMAGCAAPSVVENTATPPAPTPPPLAAQPTQQMEIATAIPPTPSSNIVTVTGWFTTIWNGEAHYSITDDQGKTFKLQLDEELTKPLGGPLELDRKRVTISGELVSENPATILVQSIQFAK